MPATAGRVRMPANNRVHSSAALQTHGIWQSAIGYDPYAPNKDDTKDQSQSKSSVTEPEVENAYASFQGLLALARLSSGSNAAEVRGACKKCNRVGHLTYQCRNFISVKDEKEKDPDAVQLETIVMEKLKGSMRKARTKTAVISSSESSDEDESESSDSDVDSEIERIIAKRAGKKEGYDNDDGGKKRKRSKKRSTRRGSYSEGNSKKEKRPHHRHRSRRSEKEKRRLRRDYSDESDDGLKARVGRRRSEKGSRKHHV